MARKQARFGQPAVYNATAPTLNDGEDSALNVDSSGNLQSAMATTLVQSTDSVLSYPRGSNFINLTASTQVLAGAGKLAGIFVAAASSTPTIKVWDALTATGTVLIGTFTPVAATQYTFHNARATTGLYVTIGGTVDCTVFYDPTTT